MNRLRAHWYLLTMRGMDVHTIPPNLLTQTDQGTWRIAGTRVSADSVVAAFWAGSTPEEICQDYNSLSLPQVYRFIAFYLENQQQVDAYLQAQRQAADHLRETLRQRHSDNLTSIRQRLLVHRQAQETPASA